MDIRFTKQAELDLACFDTGTKAWLKDYIGKLPNGDIRKLADFSTGYRLRAGDHCIIYEEKTNRKAGQALTFNRDQMLEMGAITFIIMKIIPRAVTWMEEIEAIRVGRSECKLGLLKSFDEVVWE